MTKELFKNIIDSKAKYNIGDTVFYLDEYLIKSAIITGIIVKQDVDEAACKYIDTIHYSYYLNLSWKDPLLETQLFKAPEDLKNYIEVESQNFKE